MTPEELAAIRERANVPGAPWESFGTGVNTMWTGATDRSGPIDDRTPVVLECHPSVAEFIAHAPTDIAALLDHADTMQARLDKVRALHTPRTVDCLAGGCADEDCYHEDIRDCLTVGVEVCAACYELAETFSPYFAENGVGPVLYPCPTVQAIDGSDQ